MLYFLILWCLNAVMGREIIDFREKNEVESYNFPYVTRAGWQARSPTHTTPLKTPVPYVVVHHSYTPPACYNKQQCSEAMRAMQNYHMDVHKWWDVGYSFAVGSDGAVYEGRGWNVLGAHSLHFNTVSIGICMIGDWSNELPPAKQIKSIKVLIATGVELGYIEPSYKLIGHRQVRETECPGQKLYDEIKTWTHFSSFPSSYADLENVDELRNYNTDVSKANSTGG